MQVKEKFKKKKRKQKNTDNQREQCCEEISVSNLIDSL